ncbi:unnamed protein product [Effrenium voratum]|nr:unnamed protein product [Effrenium voratum]
MLMEFLCLFFLGIVQQLLECVSLQKAEAKTLQRKKLTVLYWWPLLVWLCDFTLSLARGTLLGLCFLLLLLGKIFNSTSGLSIRVNWVWRARLFALLFLLVGLAFQSPLLPCSRASCVDGLHQIYLSAEQCERMEGLDLSILGSEASSAQCLVPGEEALGHDTTWTLAVQTLGIRRVQGDSFWDGLWALFFSQLGQLVLLILAATVQLRMYSSKIFWEYRDVFLVEPEEVIFARAQRFAHEFYCRVKLEERASRHRMQALVEKLHRTKQKIRNILELKTEESGGKSVRRQFKYLIQRSHEDQDVAIEELQMNCGLTKEHADQVMQMFSCNVEIGKQYANLLQQIALGRLKPDGWILRRLKDA